ncbi:hypothetical protein F7725_023134 [Dissostichus mawsoni]|uniref:Uncharacterized protein n=1 Tax=Dissostichus mawsoni TaxID=36200 RepID=A0A7J5Z208_DISMA|nr:hypothetical protein F7725_023134 [Dissostichus mawsoni]
MGVWGEREKCSSPDDAVKLKSFDLCPNPICIAPTLPVPHPAKGGASAVAAAQVLHIPHCHIKRNSHNARFSRALCAIENIFIAVCCWPENDRGKTKTNGAIDFKYDPLKAKPQPYPSPSIVFMSVTFGGGDEMGLGGEVMGAHLLHSASKTLAARRSNRPPRSPLFSPLPGTVSIMILSGSDHFLFGPALTPPLLDLFVSRVATSLFLPPFTTLLTCTSFLMPHLVTDDMGIRNESFMKIAAVGTWMGDFVTAWMFSTKFPSKITNVIFEYIKNNI